MDTLLGNAGQEHPSLRQDGQLRKRLKTKTLVCMHHLIRADIRRESSCAGLVNPLANTESSMFFSAAFDTVMVYNIAKEFHCSALRRHNLLVSHLTMLWRPLLPTPKARRFSAPHLIQPLSMVPRRGYIAPPPQCSIYLDLICADTRKSHNVLASHPTMP